MSYQYSPFAPKPKAESERSEGTAAPFVPPRVVSPPVRPPVRPVVAWQPPSFKPVAPAWQAKPVVSQPTMADATLLQRKLSGIKMVDLRMIDPFGEWQHFSIPAEEFTPAACAEGVGFDGSSIRMWQGIEVSDMLVIPDLTTARRYPFFEHPTLVVICDVKDPVTGTWYDRDPRRIARLAEEHLKSTGIADTVNFGPELEFFVFDHVAFETAANRAL